MWRNIHLGNKTWAFRLLSVTSVTVMVFVAYLKYDIRVTAAPIPIELAHIHEESISLDKESISTGNKPKTPNVKWSKFNKRKPSIWIKHMNKQTNVTKHRETETIVFNISTTNMMLYDIMNMEPIKFSPIFLNPCWTADGSNGPRRYGQLHCLPYFYIIGVKKSGTTDLYSRLRVHPEFCAPRFGKESQWLARIRFRNTSYRITTTKSKNRSLRNTDSRTVRYYIAMFDSAASCIMKQRRVYQRTQRVVRRNRALSSRNDVQYRGVTADGSPSQFHMHTEWEQLPGNEGLSEPRYTNFHYIKHLTPDAKIIILFRDPVTRLYSDFIHTTNGKYANLSPEVFHNQVLAMVDAYRTCFHRSTERSCVFNNTLKKRLKEEGVHISESFHAGFYAVFMRELFTVFSEDQLLPILMTDYITNMQATLTSTIRFLKMTPVSSSTMQRMLTKTIANVGRQRHKRMTTMYSSTREMLYEFYRPYNADMAALMKDERYLFAKPVI